MRVLNWALDAQKTVGGKIISVILSVALIFSFSNFFYGDNAFADTEEDTKSELVDQVSDKPAEENSEVVVPAKQTEQKPAAKAATPQVNYATLDEFHAACEAMGDATDVDSALAALDKIESVYNRLSDSDKAAVADEWANVKAYADQVRSDNPDEGVETLANGKPGTTVHSFDIYGLSEKEIYETYGSEIVNQQPYKVSIIAGEEANLGAYIGGGDASSGNNHPCYVSSDAVQVPNGQIQNPNKAIITGTTGATAYLLYTNPKSGKNFLFEINVIGQKGEVSYTVEYYYDGVKDDTKTELHSAESGTQIDSYAEKQIDGYKFDRVENCPLTLQENDSNVISVYYVKDEEATQPTNYTVHYTINGVEQEADKVEVTSTAWINDDPAQIAIAEGGIPAPTDKYIGYKLDPNNAAYPAAGTMVSSGTEYTVNYVADEFPYTINYIDQATGNALQAPLTADAVFGTEVTAEAVAIDGYVLVSDQQQTITMGVENNVINFYYAADTIGTDPTNPDQGDGIPDMYQARVDFAANNGTVNIGHTYVTLLDANGNPAVNGTGYLQQAQIPTATANDGFDQASLTWDTTPGVSVAIMGAMTFTANFTAIPAPTPTPTPVPTPVGPAIPAATPAVAPAPAAPAAAPAAPAVVIPDEENPLAAPEQEIADDENPLAAFDHEECWVHWFMIAGILLTIIYGAVVVLRRTRNTKHIDKMEKALIGTTDESTVTVGSAHHSHA